MATDKKRTRVNLVNDVIWEMIAPLPNVTAREDIRPTQAMCDILYNAARAQPTWTFEVTGTNHRATIRVTFKDEKLCEITNSWSKRAGEYIPFIHADRLPYMRRRGNSFSHKEAAPILRKFREHVYPKTLAEKTESVASSATSVLYTLEREASRLAASAKGRMHAAAIEFALSTVHMPQFLEYERTFGTAAGRETLADIKMKEEAEADEAFLNKLRAEAGKAAALVMRNTDGWLVKLKEDFTQYEEGAIPEHLSNIHVLQLAPENKALQDIGVRLGANVFVVIPA